MAKKKTAQATMQLEFGQATDAALKAGCDPDYLREVLEDAICTYEANQEDED